MRRIRAVLLSALFVLGLTVAVAPAAGATATVCSNVFCFKIEGSGTHVDWTQMSMSLKPGQTFKGHFDVSIDYNYSVPVRTTHSYTWTTPSYYLGSHRYYTGHWTIYNDEIYAYGTTIVCAQSIGNIQHTACIKVHP